MKTVENDLKRLWILVVIYITCLLLGSFVVSKNLYDLAYLILFHIFNTIGMLSKDYEADSSCD